MDPACSEQRAMPGGVTDTVLTPRPKVLQDPQGPSCIQSRHPGPSQAGVRDRVACVDSWAVFSRRQQLEDTPVCWLHSAAVPGAGGGGESGLRGQVPANPHILLSL